MSDSRPLDTAIVAVRETAGSALYGMLDVLSVTGNVWQTLTRTEPMAPPFRVRVVSVARDRFCCGNGIPVEPAAAIHEMTRADLVILPELWLGPDEHLKGRYPSLVEWIRERYKAGACVYSACSGALMLAETGLLNGCDATSHWGYQDLFRRQYPEVRFRPEPNLCFADAGLRIVTAGGTTSWHDLALHIISRHVSQGEAMRIAKVYLLKWHDEGRCRTSHSSASSPIRMPWCAAVNSGFGSTSGRLAWSHASSGTRGCRSARSNDASSRRRALRSSTTCRTFASRRRSGSSNRRTRRSTRSALPSGMRILRSFAGCSGAGPVSRQRGTGACSNPLIGGSRLCRRCVKRGEGALRPRRAPELHARP
jgi:transcriptional regulator GlxA family with amidase domain